MRIAIIGTGNVGGALGRTMTRAGHDVLYAARDAGKTRARADKLGADSTSSPAQPLPRPT